MQPKSPVNAVAVRKEEKEARLREFVSAQWALADAAPGAAGGRSAMVVARACDSPVVAVLKSLQPEIAARGIAVVAVFVCDRADPRPAEMAVAHGWTIRCLTDMRFREAHEQLVLGDACAWIGDSMRRDPQKRDAFESYAADCPFTADIARKSFQRLWLAGHAPTAAAAASGSELDVVAAVARIDQLAEGTDGPTAMTRQ